MANWDCTTWVCPQCKIEVTKRKRSPFCSRQCAGLSKRKPVTERFWRQVDKRGPDDCWLWTGNLTYGGYGVLNLMGKRNTTAHRFSWSLHNGPIPEGAGHHGTCIRHKCEARYPTGDMTGRRCVNPAHLETGTHQDNMADKAKSGRSNAKRGEGHSMVKLTEADVRDIRSSRQPRSALAAKYKEGLAEIAAGKGPY